MADEPKFIPVVCPDAWEKYGHKRALFRVVLNGKQYTRIGDFRIHHNPVRIILQIHPALDGEPHSFEDVHLSQEAVDSIRPIQNQAEYEFVVTGILGNCLFRKKHKK